MSDDQEIRIFPDGDQWCALRGPDLQEGVSGFGATPEEALMNLKRHVATALRAQPKCTLRLYVDVIDECGNCPAYRRPCHGGQPYCVRTARKIIWGSDWAGTPTWCPLKQIDAAGVSE